MEIDTWRDRLPPQSNPDEPQGYSDPNEVQEYSPILEVWAYEILYDRLKSPRIVEELDFNPMRAKMLDSVMTDLYSARYDLMGAPRLKLSESDALSLEWFVNILEGLLGDCTDNEERVRIAWDVQTLDAVVFNLSDPIETLPDPNHGWISRHIIKTA